MFAFEHMIYPHEIYIGEPNGYHEGSPDSLQC